MTFEPSFWYPTVSSTDLSLSCALATHLRMHVGCVITLAGPPRVYDKTGALLTTVMATRLVPLTPGLALPLFPGCAAVKDQLHVVLDQVGLDAKNVIIGQFQHPVSRAFSYYSTRSGRHGRLLLVAPSCSSTMRLRARKCTSPHATAQAIIRSASSALGAQLRKRRHWRNSTFNWS